MDKAEDTSTPDVLEDIFYADEQARIYEEIQNARKPRKSIASAKRTVVDPNEEEEEEDADDLLEIIESDAVRSSGRGLSSDGSLVDLINEGSVTTPTLSEGQQRPPTPDEWDLPREINDPSASADAKKPSIAEQLEELERAKRELHKMKETLDLRAERAATDYFNRLMEKKEEEDNTKNDMLARLAARLDQLENDRFQRLSIEDPRRERGFSIAYATKKIKAFIGTSTKLEKASDFLIFSRTVAGKLTTLAADASSKDKAVAQQGKACQVMAHIMNDTWTPAAPSLENNRPDGLAFYGK